MSLKNDELYYHQYEYSITESKIEWLGPFSWIGYERQHNLDKMPDIEGVYLWTFQYKPV
jgi:hypothetical protein